MTAGAHFPPIVFAYDNVSGAWVSTFHVPEGQFGWGNYTVNVRALAEDPRGTRIESDWWPRLVVH